jgi:hypothetical protein
MISTFIITILFLLNMGLALAMVYTFDNIKVLERRGIRLFLLIPPVAITIFFCVTIYGILYSLYLLLTNYLK